jgi:hypothetical protein
MSRARSSQFRRAGILCGAGEKWVSHGCQGVTQTCDTVLLDDVKCTTLSCRKSQREACTKNICGCESWACGKLRCG